MEHIEVAPLAELRREKEAARREAINCQQDVEPTDEEKKNGWTSETLTKYLAERMAAQSLSVDIDSLQRQRSQRRETQNHRYNVLRWRK